LTARGLAHAWPVALALGLAVLWPLVAYAVHPWTYAVVLLLAAAAVAVATRPESVVALVLLLAPFTNAAIGGGRPIRFLESGLALAALAYGVLLARRRSRLDLPGYLPVAVVLFLLVGGASTLHAVDASVALNRFLGLVAATALLFAVIELCRGQRQSALVVGGAVAGLLLTALFGVFQKLAGQTSSAGVVIEGEVVGRIAGAFSHPNQFAGYLIILIPVAGAVAATRAAPAGLRVLGGAALVLALAALAFSFTRGAILGLVGGSLLWLAVVRPRTALIVAVVVAVGGIALAPGALKERLQDPAGGDVGLRADLWQGALDIYRESPVLGVGLGNFGEGYSRLPAQLSTGTQRRLLHQKQLLVPPHANNLFLTILAEEGIIGALAFLGLIGSALTVCLRASRLDDPFGRAVGVGVGAGVSAMLVHSLLDQTLFGEMALPVFALIGVTALYVAREAGAETPDPPPATA
jgi:O-antigen ligase